MLLFQFEEVAEQWLSADDFANFREWASHPDVDALIADLSRPGALTASLNWYRANLAPATWVDPPIQFPPVTAPTMGVWSSGDFALTEQQMTGSSEESRDRGVTSGSRAPATGCNSTNRRPSRPC